MGKKGVVIFHRSVENFSFVRGMGVVLLTYPAESD